MTNISDAAAVSGTLIDIKNVNTHKVVRLSIDVPAEEASRVLAAFGWPTMVDPIPVAVARLQNVVEVTQPAAPKGASYAQEAGILCNDIRFQMFLGVDQYPEPAEEAASVVRVGCGVRSRKDLVEGTPAGMKWRDWVAEFKAWNMGIGPLHYGYGELRKQLKDSLDE